MSRTLKAVDLFCGAGGTSAGIINAARVLGRALDLIAVNHWTTAINSHTLNHPSVKHICEPVENLWPARVIPSRHLNLLAASCECTFHSNARGGGPCNEQSRSQPWQIIRWITDLTIDAVLMENVPEFRNWGPLHRITKRPIKSRKGEFFENFLKALRDHGYTVEWKIQNAAAFGDPTLRRRFILLAKRGKAVTWPQESHGPDKKTPYLSARDHVIDWSLKGLSIFNRKKSLSPNTIRRITAGLQTFGGPHAEPFLVMLRGTTGAHLDGSHQSVDEPIPAVTTTGKHHYLAQPFIIPKHAKDKPRSLDRPLAAMTTRSGQALVETLILTVDRPVNNRSKAKSVKEPVPTVTGQKRIGLIEPVIVHCTHQGKRGAISIKGPLPTVTGAHRGEMAIAEPVIVQTDQTGSNGHCTSPVGRPLKTIVSKQNMALVEPFVVKYYGSGRGCKHLRQPLDTVTTKDRFMLIEPKTNRVLAELDILFRMLQPHELAAAHSFPKNYIFTGNKGDQTKQIGNSVPVKLAEAHAKAVLS